MYLNNGVIAKYSFCHIISNSTPSSLSYRERNLVLAYKDCHRVVNAEIRSSAVLEAPSSSMDI